jgi:hypothetical protein
LVVDEVGYLPLERQAANLLFALVSRRYERGSIVITSNRGFEQWGEILGDAMVAAALIDRLVHHATMIILRARATGYASAASTSRPPLRLRRSATPPNRRKPYDTARRKSKAVSRSSLENRSHRSAAHALRAADPSISIALGGALFAARKWCTFRRPLTTLDRVHQWLGSSSIRQHRTRGLRVSSCPKVLVAGSDAVGSYAPEFRSREAPPTALRA